MKTSSRVQTLRIARGAVIAALYVALTLPFAPISFGPIQFRISEALTVLPALAGSAVPGVTLGCLLSNLLAGAPWPDVVFGTLATLVGAVGTRMLRHRPKLIWIPPVLANALIIPWVLKFAYEVPDLIPYMMLTVGAGEVIAVGGLGMLLYAAVSRKRSLFEGEE